MDLSDEELPKLEHGMSPALPVSERHDSSKERGVVFAASLFEASHFKTCAEIFSAETEIATMIVTSTGISISIMNTQMCAVYSLDIRAKSVRNFYYNANRGGQKQEMFPISFRTQELCMAMKGIDRKDSIDIIHNEDEDRFAITMTKSGTKGESRGITMFVQITNGDCLRYEIPILSRDCSEFSIMSSRFVKLCKATAGSKSLGIEIVVHRSCLCFLGITSENGLSFFDSVGDEAIAETISKLQGKQEMDSLEGFVQRIFVPSTTIRALSKSNNICGSTTMIIFSCDSPATPLKMSMKVGNASYGDFTICLRNPPKR